MEINIFFVILIGFIAQIIDGSLGMAYGITANSFLLALGYSPAIASASVHAAEIVTTLVSFDGNVIKPYIAIYLLIMGVRILFKAFTPAPVHEKEPRTSLLAALGLTGGACDAIGGGGWGPVVTTTLISTGHSPNKTIGSVNFSEFFVTLAESVVFVMTIGLTNWEAILGLLIGGVIAAPFGALLTKKLSTKTIMIVVGSLIVFLQFRTLYSFLLLFESV